MKKFLKLKYLFCLVAVAFGIIISKNANAGTILDLCMLKGFPSFISCNFPQSELAKQLNSVSFLSDEYKPDAIKTAISSILPGSIYETLLGTSSYVASNPYTVDYYINNTNFNGNVGIQQPASANNYTALIRSNYYYTSSKLRDRATLSSIKKNFGPEINPFILTENFDNIASYAGACRCEILKEQPRPNTNPIIYDRIWSCNKELNATSSISSGVTAENITKDKVIACMNYDQKGSDFVRENMTVVTEGGTKKWVSSKQNIPNPIGTTRVIRPVNPAGADDIIYMSFPLSYQYKRCTGSFLGICYSWEKGVDSYDYALSSRLKIGYGHYNYHVSYNIFSIILGILLSIFAPYIAIIWLSVSTSVVGLIGLSGALVNVQAVIATVPSVYGTVEQSINNPSALGMCQEGRCWQWNWTEEPAFLKPPVIDFKAPETVEYDDPINLSWKTTGAVSCSASGEWEGSKAATSTSTNETIVKPRGDHTFELTCANSGGISDQAVVHSKVVEIPRCTFTANPTTIAAGQSSTLNWTCKFAQSCTLDQSSVQVNSSRVVKPTSTTNYVLNCKGLDGDRSFSTTVNVSGTAATSTNWWENAWWKEILPE